MSSKKVLMIVGDYVEDYEAMVPYQMMLMIGYQVDVISPEKKAGEYVKTAIHDFEGDQTYSEKKGHNFFITADFSQIKVAEYDGLVIPGGRAPEYLRLNQKVLDIVKYFSKESKPIAAICHGPQILVSAGVLSGRTCTSYIAIKPDIEMSGGIFVEPNATASNVVVDGNIVTSPAWPGHPEWMRAFLTLLGSKIEI